MFKATQADYDRQKAEGRAEGRDEGRKAERKKNIKNAVAELKKELKSKEAVTDMVMRIFQLDEQTAAKAKKKIVVILAATAAVFALPMVIQWAQGIASGSAWSPQNMH